MKTRHDNLMMVARFVFVGLVWTGLVTGVGQAQGAGPPIVTYFDVIAGESTEGPPYPTLEPMTLKAYDKASPKLADLPLEQVTLNYSITPPEVPTTMTAIDSGGGLDSAGTVATFVAYLKVEGVGEPSFPQTMSHQMWIDIVSLGGGGTIVPGASTFGDSFFDVYFDASFPEGKILSHHLHGEVAGGESLPLEDVSFNSVVLDNTPTDAYDCFLKIDMTTSGAVLDLNQPLMTIELTGTYVPEPATLAVVVIGGVLALLRRGRFA